MKRPKRTAFQSDLLCCRSKDSGVLTQLDLIDIDLVHGSAREGDVSSVAGAHGQSFWTATTPADEAHRQELRWLSHLSRSPLEVR